VYKDRVRTIDLIRNLEIPKIDLAGIANVSPPRVTEFIHHRQLPREQAERIQRAVEEIGFVWACLAPFKIDTSSPEIFREAVNQLRGALAKLGSTQVSLASLAARTEETVGSRD
jgi:hypothetical protein